MEKIIIKKLDNTISEINLVTAFSLEDNNIIIYLTKENPDIVNVTVKTAVGLDSISDELFQKVTEALQTMNEDIFKNNTIDVANTLSEVGTPKKFRINGNFDEFIGNLNTMYQSSGKKVLQAEEKAPFPMSSPVPQEVTSVAPSVDTSSAGDLNNAPFEPKSIQVDSPVDKVTPPEKPVEMTTPVLQPSIDMEGKQSEEKYNESWNPYFGGIDPLSPNFPTVKNPEIFVSPTKPEIPVLPKNQEMPVLPSSETFVSPSQTESLSVEASEYRKVSEGYITLTNLYLDGLPKDLVTGLQNYELMFNELDKKYNNESNTNNLQP